MTEDFKRKLTAILSADVVGYSRLMEATADKSDFQGGSYDHDYGKSHLKGGEVAKGEICQK